MIVAYAEGPPVAIFAGSWLCSRSPVDGSPIALGEPVGDCEDVERLERLSSIATSVYLLKSRGLKVFYGGADEEGRLAAYAGGADAALDEVKHRFGIPEVPDDSAFVVVEAEDAGSLRRALRVAGEVYRRRIDVLLVADLKKALELGRYASGVVLRDVAKVVSFESSSILPDIGRCAHCGVDFLMYGSRIARCIYCGRALRNVLTQRKPPLRPEILRAIHRKLTSGALPERLVVV
ncbi:MAG: hypothetical protein ACP5KY_01920 [Thermoproteus sp.]